MKIALLIVALCASVALTHSKPETRGIFDGITNGIDKIKAFYEYLKSEEFQNKVKAIVDRLKAAPNKAVDCFTAAAQGNQADIDAIGQKIKARLEEDFPSGDENENGFEKLLRIATGISKVLGDTTLRGDIMSMAGEYQDAAKEGLSCFKTELQGIKGDVQKILDDIKERFF